MDTDNSQSFFYFEQPRITDKIARRYYIKVINALHHYDLFQEKENLQNHMSIDGEEGDTTRHVRWAEEVVPIPRIVIESEAEEESSDNELYGGRNSPDPEENFPESSERSTLLSLSDEPDDSDSDTEADGPFREPESEEEDDFEPPFPDRKTNDNQVFNEDEEDFVVPFPRLRHEERNNK
jgi:hypothetical protein